MSYSKKDEDNDQAIFKVDRTSVFQEARVFNTSPISPRKCRILLTKIAYLLYTGERFPTSEATDLFFGITKLFQHRDASLRQMVYVVVKELADTAEDVIMITSSVMKDVAGAGGRGSSEQDIYRANAIRALCRIIDGTTVQAIERLLKTAIVDKTPSVSSAALVSSYHLLPTARDVVRRWANETQEAVLGAKSSGFSLGFGSAPQVPQGSGMTQYHAIGLLYQMRSHDRMALVKMVQQYSTGNVKNPAAVIMLVRLAAKIADEDPGLRKPMYELLEGWLRHKAEMVNFEAAKAICNLRDVTDTEVAPAIHVLQLFLTSPRAVAKFTAIRILHRFASIRPGPVNICNMDIETLISNSNRSIATFAITTLLKTGNEASVDRLMKQISGFMADITDEFKITIVEAIRTLCLKFPSKQAGMLSFLSGVLRDEGGYEFKKTVVESMFDLIKFVPESREEALAHLCEFIEDCEFTKLAVRVLHLLGREGPKTAQPTKYIRYIYNRVVLENAIVRAAAVTALAKFGAPVKDGREVDPEVKKSVIVLLTRCLDDPDDEVRDRAALNLRLIQGPDEEIAEKFIRNESSFSLPVFEHQLVMYVTGDKATFAEPFDVSSVPIVTREQQDAEDRSIKMRPSEMPTLKAPTSGPSPRSQATTSAAESAAASASAAQKYMAQLAAVPELKPYGQLLKSSSETELTESETEYSVTSVKHIFKEHIVLQFNVKNTLTEALLEDVSMITIPRENEETGELEVEEDFIIPIPKLTHEEPGVIYVSFKRLSEEGYPITTFSNTLKFTSKEIDPATGEPEDEGYEDEYQVEDLDLTVGDYIVPSFAGSWANVWEQVGAAGGEATETYSLGTELKGLQEATELLVKQLSMQPLEGSDVVMNSSTHELKLFGKTVSGGRVAASVRMAYSSKSGVALKVTARSEEEGVAQALADGIA
ncbi:Coatomer, gamma subunit [Ascodesmis nigricans]|uniref:Coatomer subunit gamma n=1 Tax=Ascodesmis nigricans TaxID=341454 RepID=A0A4S2N1E6_9PEZI|nr:Coatomer, gamma subunit [Ascodesmis nigricans]